MKKTYDVLVIGPGSLDHNIDYQGNERKEGGGAGVASGLAAAKSGNRTAVFTKLNPADADVEERFAGSGADVYWNKDQTKYSEQETNPPASGVMISTIQKAMESLGITEKQLFYNLGVRSWDEIGTQEFKVAMEKFDAEKKKRGIA